MRAPWHHPWGIAAAALTLSLLAPAIPARAQRGGDAFDPAAAEPAPRLEDGRVQIGARAGETGFWFPLGGAWANLADNDDLSGPSYSESFFPGRPTFSQVPLQPWARAVLDYRRLNRLEPHARCKASGGVRQFQTPYGVEIVELDHLDRIYIFDVGGPHSYRIIHMDAEHPDDVRPTYYGHSIGWWEGDTLVVDTIGFNERFWFDRRGFPHTERLHLVERFTRTSLERMSYEVTIEDPGVYTEPWTSGFYLVWTPGWENFEYVCQENNLASDLMIGTEDAVDRAYRVVP